MSNQRAPVFFGSAGIFALMITVRAAVRHRNAYKRGVKALEKNGAEKELTEREKKLIDLIRSIGYGEIRITVQDGQPVLVEEVKKSIKL